MVCIFLEFIRCQADKSFLDFEWRLPFGNTGAVGNAKNMCVDGDRGLTKCSVEHHVGRLAPYTG